MGRQATLRTPFSQASLPLAVFTHLFINIEKEPRAAGPVVQSTRS